MLADGGHRARPADPARRRAPDPSTSTPASRPRASTSATSRPGPGSPRPEVEQPHPRRLRRPHGVRRPARRRAGGRGPLRPLAHPVRGRGGVLRRRPPHRARGMATLLLEYLAAAARRAGISALHRHRAAHQPADGRGCSARPGSSRSQPSRTGVIEVRLDLQPTPEAEAAIEDRAASGPRPRPCACCWRPARWRSIGAGRRAERRRPRRAAQPARTTSSPGPSTRSTRRPTTSPACRPCPSLDAIDGPVDLAVVVVPAAEVPARGRGVRAQGRQGGDRDLGRLRRGRPARARPLSAATLRAARRLRHPPARPQLPGRHQHRPGRAPARHLRHAPRPAGAGRPAVASRAPSAASSSTAWAPPASGPRRSPPSATGPTCRPTTCCSVGPTTPAPSWCCCTSSRSATPASSAASPASSAARKPIVAVKSGRGGPGLPRRTAADVPSATVEALLRQTGVVRVDTLAQLLDVARVLACQPLPAGRPGGAGGQRRRVAGAGGRRLRRRRAGPRRRSGPTCGPRSARAAPGARRAPSTWGSRPTATTWSGRWRPLLADEGVDACWSCAPRRPASDGRGAHGRGRRRRPPGQGHAAAGLRVRRPPRHRRRQPAAAPAVTAIPAATRCGRCRCSTSPTTWPTPWAGSRSTPRGGRRPRATFVVPDGARPGDARALLVEALAGEGDPAAGGRRLPTGVTLDVLAAAGLAPVPSRLAGDPDAAVAAAAAVRLPGGGQGVRRSRAGQDRGRGRRPRRPRRGRAAGRAGPHGGAARRGRVADGRPADGGPGVDVAVTVADHPLVGPVLTLGPGGVATPLARRGRAGPAAHRPRRRGPGGRLARRRPARRRGRGRTSPTCSCGWAPWWRRPPRSWASNSTRSSSRARGPPSRTPASTPRPPATTPCRRCGGSERPRGQRGRGSRGRPRVRSPRMFRRICVVPPMIV